MHILQKINLLIDDAVERADFGDLTHVWNPIWSAKQSYSHPDIRLFKTVDKIKTIVDAGVSFQKKKILDIGCGNGSTLFYLHKQYGSIGCGIDISAPAVADARQISDSGDLYFQVGDARAVPFGPKTFDIVLSWGVIEHFSQDLLALSEAYRVLRPGGTLILIQPNLSSFAVVQEWYLKARKRWSFGRHKKYSARRWKCELKRCGFSFAQSFTRPPYGDMPIVRLFDRTIKRIFPFFGHYLYIIAKR